jgi:N-acetylglucosaminyl-diphospho-decaprenol L-rhamnosyltransferase
MTAPSTDVVIPTYNGRDLIQSCLEHLRRQSQRHRVIVVDDGSSDDTIQVLRRDYPEAQVVALRSNGGFSRAVNAGIAAGSGELVVVLNNDVECRADFVERIIAPLREDEGVGMVAGLLLQADGGPIDSVGLEVDRTLAPFPRLWGRSPGNGAVSGTSGLLGPAGAAAAYRRSALSEVGGFDERIFGYGEDVDLALRFREAGWACAVAPDAIGVHLGAASFGRHSSFQVYHRGWSRSYLIRKYRVLDNPGNWPRAIFAETATVIWQLIATRDTAGLRGRLSGWRAGDPSHSVPAGAVNHGIGVGESLGRRRAYRGG